MWGTTTNTNLDIIDQGINGVHTETLAVPGDSSSPNTLPITDGATSAGRNKLIEFVDGGDLGATAYVQLTPNDAEKIVFMRNSLSGGRSVIVFQGTYNASNDFEIPNGKDVVLKFDGAGVGATVKDVFNDLEVTAGTINSLQLASGVTVTAILDEDDMSSDSDTALATQQSIKAYLDAFSPDLTAVTTDVSPNTDDNNDLGSASKRWQDLYLSGGVYIGGTSSANFIDDYEEGTFTINNTLGPLNGGTGGGVGSTNVGTYVKTGNMVMGTVLLSWATNVSFANADDLILLERVPLWPTTQQFIGEANHSSSPLSFVAIGGIDLRPSTNLNGWVSVYAPDRYLPASPLGPYGGVHFNFYFYINQ